MLDQVILFVSINALWLSILLIPILFVIRLYTAYRKQLPLNRLLFMVLSPFSYGYLTLVKSESSKIKRIYVTLIITQFILILLGLIIVIYTRYL